MLHLLIYFVPINLYKKSFLYFGKKNSPHQSLENLNPRVVAILRAEKKMRSLYPQLSVVFLMNFSISFSIFFFDLKKFL